jgi:hypothetical protein
VVAPVLVKSQLASDRLCHKVVLSVDVGIQKLGQIEMPSAEIPQAAHISRTQLPGVPLLLAGRPGITLLVNLPPNQLLCIR